MQHHSIYINKKIKIKNRHKENTKKFCAELAKYLKGSDTE